MRFKALLLWVACLVSCLVSAQSSVPKREFRGAWIQCVNGQFQGLSTEQAKQMLTGQLNKLQQAGINAIIFQVRAECDALYQSPYEPWSRFLTGAQGKAPSSFWDPMQFMIEACHERGMEFHAWINPYRARTKGTSTLAPSHPYRKNPERFVTYNGQLYCDPGIPENRQYILKIVRDIVNRYDVDAIHMDDYFYPYPNPGEDFPDNVSFARYGRGYVNRGDWRRDNVNLLIKELHETIRACKPWVKFGISPFGIYRNARSAANGSQTNGLQNYDDLYADVLLWVNNGWIDYNIPQVYWEIGHSAADYDTLVRWWAKHASARPLYIGQDVDRTVAKADKNNPRTHQMHAKMMLQRAFPAIQGSCQWYAAAVVENKGRYHDLLVSQYHKYPALLPTSPFMDNHPPRKVRKVKSVWTEDGFMLFWQPGKANDVMDEAVQFVVYRFEKGEKINLADATKIVSITRDSYCHLPYENGKKKYHYVVTALDRLHNESQFVKKSVKL
ncbi:MAG: glycoside hydrolase family 10 protein [Phocaeicola sp.]